MHPQTSSAPPLQNLLRTTITMLEKTAAPIKGISRAGSFLLVVLVMLTFLDVFLRYFLGQPIAGSMELTGTWHVRDFLLRPCLGSTQQRTYFHGCHCGQVFSCRPGPYGLHYMDMVILHSRLRRFHHGPLRLACMQTPIES